MPAQFVEGSLQPIAQFHESCFSPRTNRHMQDDVLLTLTENISPEGPVQSKEISPSGSADTSGTGPIRGKE